METLETSALSSKLLLVLNSKEKVIASNPRKKGSWIINSAL
jgi:hypothetical protein